MRVAHGRDPALRAELEVTLAQIEDTEQRLPPSKRYDVGILRRALGLDA